MPTTYDKCPHEVLTLAGRIMRKHHPDLVTTETRIAYLFATNPDGDAVKVGGYPCAAKVKIIPLIQRADGRADAEVVIDAEHWKDAAGPTQEALIDHELHHLMVQWESLTVWKTDDLGRPKLKLRKHDHQFGWFNVIAERHADASYEVQQAKAFADKHGQTYFGWSAPPDRPVESLKAGMDSGEVQSVTISSGGKSVTLTAKHRAVVKKMLRDNEAAGSSAPPIGPDDAETKVVPAVAVENVDDQDADDQVAGIERRNREILALNNPPADDFTEDAQLPGTLKPICDAKGHLAVNVVQYTSGRWRSDYWISVGELDLSRKMKDSQTFATREEAALNAIGAVRDALGRVRATLKGGTEKVAQKIVWALESGEKGLSLTTEPKARKTA